MRVVGHQRRGYPLASAVGSDRGAVWSCDQSVSPARLQASCVMQAPLGAPICRMCAQAASTSYPDALFGQLIVPEELPIAPLSQGVVLPNTPLELVV